MCSHSGRIWVESETQRKEPRVPSCCIFRGNLTVFLCVRRSVCRFLIASTAGWANPSFFMFKHHNLPLDVIRFFRDSGSGFRRAHRGCVSQCGAALLPRARFVCTAKPSISLGWKSSLPKRETRPPPVHPNIKHIFLIGPG